MIQILTIVMLFSDAAYQFAYSLCTASIVISWTLAAAYMVKWAWPRRHDGQMGALVLAAFACAFLTVAVLLAGVELLMLCCIAYVPGIFFYVRARKERGSSPVMTRKEKALAAFIIVVAIAAVALLACGVITHLVKQRIPQSLALLGKAARPNTQLAVLQLSHVLHNGMEKLWVAQFFGSNGDHRYTQCRQRVGAFGVTSQSLARRMIQIALILDIYPAYQQEDVALFERLLSVDAIIHHERSTAITSHTVRQQHHDRKTRLFGRPRGICCVFQRLKRQLRPTDLGVVLSKCPKSLHGRKRCARDRFCLIRLLPRFRLLVIIGVWDNSVVTESS